MNESISVIEPEGTIDNAGGDRIRQDVSDRLDAGAMTILIDLEKITFMDSSGLGAMITTLKAVKAKGATLYLCTLSDQIKIIMEITRLDDVFNILPDREAFNLAIAP
jgi:anti-sigma B factor antagonist